jgi:3-phosphoshikimate 1-carboxyvinyltransferase
MHERPIDLLIQGLNDLGANIRSEKNNGCPPLIIDQSNLKGGHTVLSGQVSSQFFSGLMMAAPLAQTDTVIEVSDEWLSKPYIEMTALMLKDFGIQVEIGEKTISIPGSQQYISPGEYPIEPDASAATYPLGLAVLQGVPVTLNGLGSDSLQGDVKFCEVLKVMGCDVSLKEKEIYVDPPNELRAIEMDLNELPDAAMTVVVLCAVAKGKSHLWGLKNLAFKECDRLKALEAELQKVGAKVEAYEDGFRIEGCAVSDFHGAEIATYNDHRMAMCLGILGTLVPDMKICDPGCVSKTYPKFWDDLQSWLK